MRIALVVLWIIVVALAITEYLIGGRWLGEISRIPAIVSFILTIVVFVPFLASGFDWFSRLLLRMPLARGWRHERGRIAPAEKTGAHELYVALRTSITRSREQDLATAGRLFAEATGARASHRAHWPWESPWVGDWLRVSAQSIEDSLLLRILIPERSKSTAALMRSMSADHGWFSGLRPAPLEILRRGGGEGARSDGLFMDYVTRFTGAVVLADAIQTRTGLAANAKVWHADCYVPSITNPLESFEDSHGEVAGGLDRDGRVECRWGATLHRDPRTRIGDYDGRVLNITGVALGSDPSTGELNFILTSRDTCYAATERSPQACKGALETLRDAAYDAPWIRDRRTLTTTRDGRGHARLNMLTVFATLIVTPTIESGGPRSIVLSERASSLRNGPGVVSVVGGVMNLPNRTATGDIDDKGFADPRRAIAREVHEELGLEIDQDQLAPTSVFTYNQRSPGRSARGQVLTSISFTATLRTSLEALERQRLSQSKANGRYELDRLMCIELPYPDEELDRPEALQTAASALAKSSRGLAPRLDQAAMLAILYASAESYGMTATIKAFNTHWDMPWLATGWMGDSAQHDDAAPIEARLVRPISSLIDPAWFDDVRRAGARTWSPLH